MKFSDKEKRFIVRGLIAFLVLMNLYFCFQIYMLKHDYQVLPIYNQMVINNTNNLRSFGPQYNAFYKEMQELKKQIQEKLKEKKEVKNGK